MEINFKPLDLCESLNYEWIAANINEKCKVSFIFDNTSIESKKETIRMFVSELQDNEIVASYEVTFNFKKEEIFELYEKVKNVFYTDKKIDFETEAKIYGMLPFEHKYPLTDY